MDTPKIYISATRQDDGKTTTSLGLLNAIGDLYDKIGYIKPVGQQVKLIGEHEIDKDAALMNEVYRIGGRLCDMSPVAIPKGFTEDYILRGEVTTLQKKIEISYKNASKEKQFMVIEGTGHAGVGSVLDLSNAVVAKQLNASVIIVTCGGIGRPIDEVMLNKAVFDLQGVEVLGVIINKVIPSKYEKINKMVRLGFKRKNLKVFGVIPFIPVLSSPTIRQLMEDSKGELLCGEENLDENVSKVIVGAMPPHTALDYFKGEVLLITPGNREDLILAALTCQAQGIQEECDIKGMILTCGIYPQQSILKLLKNSHIPTILVQDDTFAAAKRVTNITIKIKPEDTEKIDMVKQMIKKYVDVADILESLKA